VNANNVISIPIRIEFELIKSAVVLDFSSLTVDDDIVFETTNLLVVIDLRDQWNHTVTKASSSVEIYDEDGNIVGNGTTQLVYNATLKRGQFVSRKTLYLNNTDITSPHVKIDGNYEHSLFVIWSNRPMNSISDFSQVVIWTFHSISSGSHHRDPISVGTICEKKF